MQTSVAVAAIALVGRPWRWRFSGPLSTPARPARAPDLRVARPTPGSRLPGGLARDGGGRRRRSDRGAPRYAGEAERLLGREALTLLLKAQAAQVSGNRAAAEAAFTEMMDEDETRVLGLRGLFVEARRRGDGDAAREYAGEAIRIAPAATWASDAVLEARCAERDWRGALASVERRASLGLVDKATAKRHRAVLLTADALDRAEHDPTARSRSRRTP